MLQLVGSIEYEQVEFYILNNMHLKAAMLIETMLEAIRLTRGKHS